MEENKIERLEQQDSIKLVKNSKGFNWEIKVYGVELIERVEKLNEKMESKYGKE